MGAQVIRLCTICARGGSKGVPGKNLRDLQGRPLIAHTVEQAVRSQAFAAIAVSSDSDAIIQAGIEAGTTAKVRRPAELASDTAGKIPAIVHCVQSVESTLNLKFDLIVDLDATSPLRDVEDILGAIQLLEGSKASNVITAARARRSPYFNLVELDQDGHVHLSKEPTQGVLRRQDAPRCYDMNASIYVWWRDIFLEAPAVFYPNTRLFEMPEARSHDIDTELDFAWVNHLMELKHVRQ